MLIYQIIPKDKEKIYLHTLRKEIKDHSPQGWQVGPADTHRRWYKQTINRVFIICR